jgi:hypothetical protein
VSGKSPYQWYRNNSLISGATQQTYTATTSGDYTVTYFEHCVSQKSAAATVTVNAKPTLTSSNISKIDVACRGGSTGSITVSASGVNNEYNIDGGNWQTSPTFSGLTAKTYSIRVRTSAGCVSDAVSVTIGQPTAALSASRSVTPVLCNGGNGTITVTPTGGTTPYKYRLGSSGSFQDGASFTVTAGTYSVTVKDSKECETTINNIVVSQPTALSASLKSMTPVSCNGGSDGKIEITATGGTGTYQYSINGGSFQPSETFNNLSANSYSVVVKDANDCSASQTVTVSQPAAFNIPAPTVTHVTCNGGDNGSITVSGVSGGTPPYTYSFDNGTNYSTDNNKTGLNVGIYYIRIKDGNNCESPSVPATVREPSVLLTPADVSAATACPNLPATITIANTVANVNYEIYSASTGGTHIASVVGDGTTKDVNIGIISETATFYVETNADGCVSVSRVPVTVTVRETTLNYPDLRISVCPNMSDVNLSKYIDTVDLVSLSWSSVGAPAIDESTGIIRSIPAMPTVYTLKYKASSNCTTTEKEKERKVYLQVINNSKKTVAPRDTIAVCRDYAEAMQINQLFGIEAGGTWRTVPTLASKYISQSPSSSRHAGALVFNGKAAWIDGVLPAITYHDAASNAIEIYYTVPAGNCLGGKEYKVVIVLTPNIVK